VQPADERCANWYVTGFPECAHGCHRVMAKLIVDLWVSHELVDLVGEARVIPDEAMRRGKDPVWNVIERERELKRT
jgi:hypothetical protein